MSTGIRGSIRTSWLTETGEDPGHAGASVILDRLCDAFYEKYMGAGREVAVREDPEIADYLTTCWKGNDLKELREAIRYVKTAPWSTNQGVCFD